MPSWNAGVMILSLLLGSGCGADHQDEDTAPLLADARRSDALYFGVRPDFRRCAAPACGGSFVRALNRELTTCADGSEAAECYVARIDLGRLGLSNEEAKQLSREQSRLVLVGTIIPPTRHDQGFGSLFAERAYRGVKEVSPVDEPPAGATLLTTNTGIACVLAPCPTHQGLVVNEGRTLKVDPNLTALQATPEALARAMRDPENEGVLLTGQLSPQRIPTGVDALFDVTQAYERVTAR